MVPLGRLISRRSWRGKALPGFLLLVGLIASMAAWVVVQRGVRRSESERFQHRIDSIAASVSERFAAAAQALYGARVLVEHQPDFSQVTWDQYGEAMSRFFDDGVVALAYARRVERSELDSVEAKLRAEGVPDLKVDRLGVGTAAYIVTRVVPKQSNITAVGSDLSSGTTRKIAAERAIHSGGLELTRRMPLNIDGTSVPGFMLFLPVFPPGATPGQCRPGEGDSRLGLCGVSNRFADQGPRAARGESGQL